MNPELEARIRAFLQENMIFDGDADSLAADASLLEEGIIDSTGILELVAFLEDEFQLDIEDADIVPENLDSIHSIANYVSRKSNAPI